MDFFHCHTYQCVSKYWTDICPDICISVELNTLINAKNGIMLM